MSCDPPVAVDHAMQQLINHVVKQWLRVDDFLKLYSNQKRRAALKAAADTIQSAVWGLKPLIDYDARMPKISGLIAFAGWVGNLYSQGGPRPYIAMSCCAEELARCFHQNSGDPHWGDVAKIVLEKFHAEPRAQYKKNPGRWVWKQITAFHRLWDKGNGNPRQLPIIERSSFFLWDDSYLERWNGRRQEQHELESKLTALRSREAEILAKTLDMSKTPGKLVAEPQRVKAIKAARKKSLELRDIDQEIGTVQAELFAAKKRWEGEDKAELRKISARSIYHHRRAAILNAKKKPRKRSASSLKPSR